MHALQAVADCTLVDGIRPCVLWRRLHNKIGVPCAILKERIFGVLGHDVNYHFVAYQAIWGVFWVPIGDLDTLPEVDRY